MQDNPLPCPPPARGCTLLIEPRLGAGGCLRYRTIYPVGLSDAALFPELTESSRGEK
jgi:hypothetical protein